jgi:hypothetical protein
MKPKFFSTPEDFRAWLEAHHQTKKELLVGFHKKDRADPASRGPNPSTRRSVSAGSTAYAAA